MANVVHFKANVIQLLSRVQLFATPWTAACQASPGLYQVTGKPSLYGERKQIVIASRKKGGLTEKSNKGTFWDDENVL